MSAAENTGSIQIYNNPKGLVGIVNPLMRRGELVLVDGEAVSWIVPKKARVLHEQLKKTRDYFFEKHGRKSWDGRGGDIIASLNVSKRVIIDLGGMQQNAAWVGDVAEDSKEGEYSEEQRRTMSNRFIFGAGKKNEMSRFESALDVIAHEYTHAIVDSSSKLGHAGQSGALNEHLADVFGAIIENYYERPTSPFLIGDSVLGTEYLKKASALRDMQSPAKGLRAQPAHLSEIELGGKFAQYGPNCVPANENDRCGVHVMNGIPNRMAFVVIQELGWSASSDLFYEVMTRRLRKESTFKDYARALREACVEQSPRACSAVAQGLAAVGL